MYDCVKAPFPPLVLSYFGLNCSESSSAFQTHVYQFLYLLLNIATLKMQRVELEKQILSALGLSLQSQVTFSPGGITQALTMGTINIHFQEEEPCRPPVSQPCSASTTGRWFFWLLCLSQSQCALVNLQQLFFNTNTTFRSLCEQDGMFLWYSGENTSLATVWAGKDSLFLRASIVRRWLDTCPLCHPPLFFHTAASSPSDYCIVWLEGSTKLFTASVNASPPKSK